MAHDINKYAEDVSNFKASLAICTNETQKKEHFVLLMSQLFPSKAQQLRAFVKGAEEYTRYLVNVEDESRYGFIDTLFGKLVIEFEFDLKRTGEHAEQQLREYVAKLWSSEKCKTDFICISTDGYEWKVFTPKLKLNGLTTNQIPSSHVELIPNEPYILTDDYEGFYYWLDRIFFRENRLAPQSKVICSEFGSDSPHFAKTFDGMMAVFDQAKKMKEVQVAVENWRKYLKYTYGDIEASDKLFVTHSYLSGFIKLLMAIFFSSSKKLSFSEAQISQALTGKFFYDLNVRNYVEKDFFFWVNFKEIASHLDRLWKSTFGLLKAYDFSKITNDFLKDIYQGMVDPENRHDLGEHYTPDWLCEKMVTEAIEKWKDDETLPRIADITCGSGSFLRIAVKILRKRYFTKKNIKKNEVISALTRNVIGFEIHPLAAFIAKTNYMMAMEDLLPEADEPFHIPIYLCDSLLNSELDKHDIEKRTKFAVQLAGKKCELPLVDALTDERFDNLIDYIDDIAHNYKRGELSDATIEGLLNRKIIEFLPDSDLKHADLLNSTTELTKVLHEKVLNHENSVWAFVLKNNFRPIVFNGSIDIIVGNPPWLTFKDVKSEEYRRELEDLGLRQHKIAPMSGKLRASMELATIFLTHAVDSYLKPSGKLYFLLPRSIFSADHHSNLREQTFALDMRIEDIWDLRDVTPLFNVPSCVIVATHQKKISAIKYNGRIFQGKLPDSNLMWKNASAFLDEKSKPLHVIKMGPRSALSFKNESVITGDNYYQKKFKRGADIFPRNYFFVTAPQDFKSKRTVAVKSASHIMKNAKKPYQSVEIIGRANVEFIFNTVLSDNILPHSTFGVEFIHLPVKKIDGHWELLNSTQLLNDGHRETSAYFEEAEKSYSILSSTGKTLQESLNFYGKLLVQEPSQTIWVLYCTSGKNVCASVYRNSKLFWSDCKTYWFCPASMEEAYYLSGVLNCSALNEIIKPFQSFGLFGQRDVHKKILDIGIPKFEKSNKIMKKISILAEALSKKVEKNNLKFTAKAIGKKRNQVREYFKKEFAEIDALVVKLFTKSK